MGTGYGRCHRDGVRFERCSPARTGPMRRLGEPRMIVRLSVAGALPADDQLHDGAPPVSLRLGGLRRSPRGREGGPCNCGPSSLVASSRGARRTICSASTIERRRGMCNPMVICSSSGCGRGSPRRPDEQRRGRDHYRQCPACPQLRVDDERPIVSGELPIERNASKSAPPCGLDRLCDPPRASQVIPLALCARPDHDGAAGAQDPQRVTSG